MNFFIQRSELRDLYDQVAAGQRITEAEHHCLVATDNPVVYQRHGERLESLTVGEDERAAGGLDGLPPSRLHLRRRDRQRRASELPVAVQRDECGGAVPAHAHGGKCRLQSRGLVLCGGEQCGWRGDQSRSEPGGKLSACAGDV